MEIKSLKISGDSTKREWAVYLLIATPKTKKGIIKLYVGKVGDNRKGCNPIISRIGNHFSYNKIHSQIRNKLNNPEEYNYEYFYCHFGKYDDPTKNIVKSKEKINELERELNRKVQAKIINNPNYQLLNPFIGKYVSNFKKQSRNILDESEMAILQKLTEQAILLT
ncbi:hypothetical protein HNP37_004450 [Flavobacterium nitrogenifigens]|uniref:GIY-YIG domain-containing protein n=2 Tax=Flavobacterium TaxID=237 RepID=A0A7W7N8Z2_9FLAO|nr:MULTISPECIES: hypothetical protein [Flavobacterium]MBB4804363.1 hypothetical protein [Flavobacterium nitrogenifigens]MBB6389241.1 hypothetical protein [Flavobacterium notoginsengisoli]